MAKGADMQNLITATGVTAGTGARFNKGTFVTGKE